MAMDMTPGGLRLFTLINRKRESFSANYKAAALPKSERLLIFMAPSGKRATISNSPPIASI